MTQHDLSSLRKVHLSFSFKTMMTYVNLVAACQYGWNRAAMISETCRLGEAQREEQQPKVGQVQRRTRRHRTIFTEEQLDALEELFLQNQYPDVNAREKLAQQTNLREERVEVRQQLHVLLILDGEVSLSLDYVDMNNPAKYEEWEVLNNNSVSFLPGRFGLKTEEQNGDVRKDCHL